MPHTAASHRRGRAPLRRRRRWPFLVAAIAAAVAAIVVIAAATRGTNATSGPLLASVDSAATGATVDGIQCQSSEQVVFHIHAHLAVYVNGSSRTLPQGIGIASCFYWLHTHTGDGIIHIESPVQRTYTLRNFFDIWRQPLGPAQVGPAHGAVIAYVDGKRFTGDPRDIPLGAHTLVQLDVGKDVAPTPFDFPGGL
ncbi:MAG: hypothetical protein E6J14_04920 [Chloroflexi bacterium]|nr:MAG: hypothetical protein E6J14_04920 [Chloroflexota bacterium]